ncbi:MAG: hypothetical protein M0026_04015 [Nocardiopsaceae bacterium]|nr:hypothetical protein [Nocardiopsaceae bacterium]
MPYDASATTTLSTRTRPHRTADPTAPHSAAAASSRKAVSTAAPAAPSAPAVSPEGIGDIVQAGHATGYAHLIVRDTPTIGRLAAAARAAALALAQSQPQPRRRGRWQRAPRPARRGVTGRMRVTAVSLAPNGFAALPSDSARRPAVLHLVRGRAHMVALASDGEPLAVQEVAAGRTRVLGSAGGHHIINTGPEPVVVVRVTA